MTAELSAYEKAYHAYKHEATGYKQKLESREGEMLQQQEKVRAGEKAGRMKFELYHSCCCCSCYCCCFFLIEFFILTMAPSPRDVVVVVVFEFFYSHDGLWPIREK